MKLASILVAIMVAVGFLACAQPADENQPAFIGSWKQTTADGQEIVYTFEVKKNHYSKKTPRNTVHGTYKVEEKNLVLTPRVGRESVLSDWKVEDGEISWTLPTGVRVALKRVEG